MVTQADQYSIVCQVQKEDGLKMIDLVRPKVNSTVLDLGCGTGNLTSILAERVGPGGKVIGVDPDKERLHVAREKYRASNLSFLEGSSEDFPEDKYDIVFSNYVLHWIVDKEKLFKKVHQNLKHRGCFAFTAILELPPLLGQLCDLMGPDRSNRYYNSVYFAPLEFYDKMANQYGFSVEVKADDMSRVVPYPNIDSLMKWWFASTRGIFDRTLIDPVTLDSFIKPFGDNPVQYVVVITTFIFTKL